MPLSNRADRWVELFQEVHPMQETTTDTAKADVLSEQELSRLDAYWRAANYLSVGQIYLRQSAAAGVIET